ncbi:hypothetical protein BOTNAR_0184g00210 [Botryotinia narcissicola]|uniref:Uncharacterized protein n=1 Tax=Botryotinia narcissicola TaxID=278944 RepID=A0A4Z1I9M6_9HELO|nr:hypothetical protein BOTNAR_0184g00210 [Botryotinia narcissicola]
MHRVAISTRHASTIHSNLAVSSLGGMDSKLSAPSNPLLIEPKPNIGKPKSSQSHGYKKKKEDTSSLFITKLEQNRTQENTIEHKKNIDKYYLILLTPAREI